MRGFLFAFLSRTLQRIERETDVLAVLPSFSSCGKLEGERKTHARMHARTGEVDSLGRNAVPCWLCLLASPPCRMHAPVLSQESRRRNHEGCCCRRWLDGPFQKKRPLTAAARKMGQWLGGGFAHHHQPLVCGWMVQGVINPPCIAFSHYAQKRKISPRYSRHLL